MGPGPEQGEHVTAEHILGLFSRLSADPRINVWHLGICAAVAQLCYLGAGSNPVIVTRKMVMQLSHIASIATYHKCIRQLEDYGYISYRPSYDHYRGTTVRLNINEP